jgi:protein-S-isoprenylcysteine O-methyltransferase Ste14
MVRPLDALWNVWLVWLVTWWAAAAWSSRAAKRPAIGRELWYRLLTIAGSALIFSTARSRGRYDVMFWQAQGAAGWLLVAVAIAGFAFTWWARLHLGRLWSSSVTRKADHHVVETGPYAIVRHPIYTGLLFAIAATVGMRASLATLAAAFLIVSGIYVKARLEEEFLRAELGGDAYDAYARRVPMLIPRIVSGATTRRAAR